MVSSPGRIGPDRIPARAEFTSSLTMLCLPGMPSDRFIGFYPGVPLTNPEVEMRPEDGAASTGDIGVQCLRARYWPQRPHWASTTANVIPEILEPLMREDRGDGTVFGLPATSYSVEALRWVREDRCVLTPDRNVLLLFRVNVASQTKPGSYAYHVLLTGDECPKGIPLTLVVRVLHGELHEQDQPVRTMFTSGCSRDELTVLARDTGLNSVLWAGWPGTRVTKTPEGVRVDDVGSESLSDTARSMASLGMDGPLIVSWPGLALVVGKKLGYTEGEVELLGHADVREAFSLTLTALRDRLTADGCPNMWFFPNDEPGLSERKRSLVLRQCECSRTVEIPTFLTSYFSDFNQGPGRELFTSVVQNATSPEDAVKKRAEAIERNGQWMILTGVYGDGILELNRRSGLHLLRTDADGVAFWVWCKAKENAWNDFDGNAGVEPKDAILGYPPLPEVGWNGAFVETMQYEGMRLAYQDYRVYRELEYAVEHGSGDSPAREAAQAFLAKLKGDFALGATSGELEQLRDTALVLLDHLVSPTEHPGSTEADVSFALSEVGSEAPALSAATSSPEPLPRLSTTLEIDGHLDSDEWDGAHTYGLVNNFNGEPAPAHRILVATRPEGFSVAFDCHEPEYAEARAAAAGKPTVPWANTSIEAFLDVDGDRTDYAQVIVDAAGNVWSGYFSEGEVSFEHALEGVMSAVASAGDRMHLELLIPWTAFADSERLDTWTANFCFTRHVGATREQSSFVWKKNSNFMRYHDIGSYGALCIRTDDVSVTALSTASGIQEATYTLVCEPGSTDMGAAAVQDSDGVVLGHKVVKLDSGETEFSWTAPRTAGDESPVFVLALGDENERRLRMPYAPSPVFLDAAPSVLLPNEPCLWTVRGHSGIDALRMKLGQEDGTSVSKTVPLPPGRHILSASCDTPARGPLDWELAWLDGTGVAVAVKTGVVLTP
ncbi:MAG: hypothetical protein GY851_15920 [bacterium]|nr:hypothetical protein [bacterium]